MHSLIWWLDPRPCLNDIYCVIQWLKYHIVAVFVGIAFIMVLGWVGKLDMQDELAKEKFYCEMVSDGNWNNFKHLDCDKILKGDKK